MVDDTHRPECVEQAACDNCGANNFVVAGREFDPVTPETPDDEPDDLGSVHRTLRCRDCGETGMVSITQEGLEWTDELDYSEASWNSGDEDDN